MDNITIIDSSNNEVIAVILKDEVIIKDGYEVMEDVGVEEEGGINMTRILLEDGRTYELDTEIELIVEAIQRAEENNNKFLFIAPKGVKRLIRFNNIKEVTELKEVAPINSNVNLSINIDGDEIITRMEKAINDARQIYKMC